ncbi:hypothetical protein WJU23_13410 [Prosthecobacter sp. SYSU 5D2]|uniref:hypothetical protein n=1 Tax=Prosthecobacter sp. SYSU 5D2 TaxID=3134134 RepID=UPI0031FF0E87
MRNVLISFICLAVSNLMAQEPAELSGLRTSYQSAVERAVKPLSQTYLDELKRMQETFTRDARPEAAQAVQAEITLMESKMTAMGSFTPGVQVPVLETIAVVPANSPEGFKLGNLRKGDVITLSYLSGQWKNDGMYPSDNPDAEKTERGDKTRLAITESPVNGKPGPIIKPVPPLTQSKPFTYVVQTSRNNVILRIQYGGENPKAPGAVSYKVKIVR